MQLVCFGRLLGNLLKKLDLFQILIFHILWGKNGALDFRLILFLNLDT